MTAKTQPTEVLQQLDGMTKQQIARLYVELYTKQKLGLYWEHDAIARDKALNADVVLPRLAPEISHRPAAMAATAPHRNLIIEEKIGVRSFVITFSYAAPECDNERPDPRSAL